MIPHGSDPNGGLNIESLKKDLEFFRAEGLIKGQVTVEQAVDESFAKAAVEALGPYKPKS
jgi:NitT/TauT family transport system substrate-binding protein